MKLQEQEVIEARFFPLDGLPSNIFPLQKEVIQQANVTAFMQPGVSEKT
jgi:hypothetical protein